MVLRASASSQCHSVSSDDAPSTSPCQWKNRLPGTVVRTPAASSGRPAAAARMRMARRRVILCTHRRLSVDAIGQPPPRDQRRATLIVEVLDLTVEALEAFRRRDPSGLLDRAYRTCRFTPAAWAAALGATAQPVQQMEAVERREHAT